MTKLGLEHQANVWQNRHNIATELETNRSNLAREAETYRSNRANESLQAQQNAETKRSHLVNEDIAYGNLNVAKAQQKSTDAHYRRQDKETKRSNKAKEKETSQHNRADEVIRSEANRVADRKNQVYADRNAISNKQIEADIKKFKQTMQYNFKKLAQDKELQIDSNNLKRFQNVLAQAEVDIKKAKSEAEIKQIETKIRQSWLQLGLEAASTSSQVASRNLQTAKDLGQGINSLLNKFGIARSNLAQGLADYATSGSPGYSSRQ